jgi:hypothetical protein
MIKIQRQIKKIKLEVGTTAGDLGADLSPMG